LALALVVLFAVANRGAYQGFFSGDDLDNLGWTTSIGWDVYRAGWWTPVFSADNFRPSGHVFYRLVHALAGLDFRAYVGALQGLHVANAVMLFAVCRRLGALVWPSLAASALFLFHPALFAAFWQPMYIFDVTCAALLLVAALLYLRERWLLAWVAFWLAYKAKEVAIFFPVVLAALEYFGARRWRRVAPFAAVSLSFGVQAVLANRGRDNAYSLRFTAAALWTCLQFYAPKALVPLVPLAAFARRDVRAWTAAALALVMLAPLLFLPGRLFAVYLYVPLLAAFAGLALVLARVPVPVLAACVTAWLGFVYAGPLREFRKAELTVARESRTFFDAACRVDATLPAKGLAFYEGGPPHLPGYGVEGVLHLCYSRELELRHADPRQLGWADALAPGTPLFHWNSLTKRMTVERRGASPRMSAFHLGKDWLPWMGSARWSGPVAAATIQQSPGETEFYVTIETYQAEARAHTELNILMDGQWVGTARVEKPGLLERAWPVPDVPAPRDRQLELQVSPVRRVPGDPWPYGLPFRDFGVRRPTQAAGWKP